MKRYVPLFPLLEASPEEIYEKYYSSIPIQDYETIVKLDPKSKIKGGKIKNIGKFAKRFLHLYMQKKLTLKDLLSEKDLEALLINFEGDVDKINSMQDIHLGQNEQIYDIVYKDSKWIVETNFDYNTSCERYGDHTSWCTASVRNGNHYFNHYMERGKLFVIRSVKAPTKEMFQLFMLDNGRPKELQDKRNSKVGSTIPIAPFFEENPKLLKFFMSKYEMIEPSASADLDDMGSDYRDAVEEFLEDEGETLIDADGSSFTLSNGGIYECYTESELQEELESVWEDRFEDEIGYLFDGSDWKDIIDSSLLTDNLIKRESDYWIERATEDPASYLNEEPEEEDGIFSGDQINRAIDISIEEGEVEVSRDPYYYARDMGFDSFEYLGHLVDKSTWVKHKVRDDDGEVLAIYDGIVLHYDGISIIKRDEV